MNIKQFVADSRVHMRHLTDDEFYARLPEAVILYVVMEIGDWFRSIFRRKS